MTPKKKTGKGEVRKSPARGASARGAKGGSKGGANGAEDGRRERLGIAEALASRPADEVQELYHFWSGSSANGRSLTAGEQLDLIRARMSDPEVVEERVGSLGKRMGQVLGLHLDAPGYRCAVGEISTHKTLAYLSGVDLEAALQMLQRHGLLVPCQDRKFENYGGAGHAIPVEIGDGMLRQQRLRRRGVFDLFTLRGYLDRMNDDPARARKIPPTRLRELYKVYSNESAAVARIERLPDGLRRLVEKTVLEFGGLLPKGLFERMVTDEEWAGTRWRAELEESLVGTVERLELGRYGIHLVDEVLLVFNEVALAWLKRVAVPGDPDQPDSEASSGVDLASNISRFIGFILEHNVRFTVRGEIFKTTEKRILQELIPNPGRELSRGEVLSFIYEFSRAAGLIESTGERTFAMTSKGRHWEQRGLDEKLETLVEYCIEEPRLPGDPYHQQRLRRIFIRLLKRVETGTWYDLMYLPFLARNTYLASLDQLEVEEYFTERSQASTYTPMEDPQQLAWNLARWVRQRLYLLGIVDLGYEKGGRPVALRLTRFGARLFGVQAGEHSDAPLLGSIVVTPDFEVVLFPTGDDAELVHLLDRFCVREKAGETIHFRILERAVTRALGEGMYLSRILSTLRTQSRTPVPQNVLYSITDWSNRAGLIVLSSKHVALCEDPDTFKRFQSDAGVKSHVREVIDDKRIQMKTRITPRRMQSLLRDLGFLVELT